IRTLEVEVSEDAERVGIRARGLDGEEVDRLAERARRMEHRRVHPGRRHLGQRVVDRIGWYLTVVSAHLAVLPEVDLGIDVQAGGSPLTTPGLPVSRPYISAMIEPTCSWRTRIVWISRESWSASKIRPVSPPGMPNTNWMPASSRTCTRAWGTSISSRVMPGLQLCRS